MKHVDTIHRTEAWLFDLDNTLYPASCGLMAAVSRRMTRFVAEILGVDHGTALIEQKRLFREPGTTLRGLMDRFSVDPVGFMDNSTAVDYTGSAPRDTTPAPLAPLPRPTRASTT